MDLDKWMLSRDLIDQDVADAVGISRSYFTRIRNGVVDVSLKTALKIVDFSKGRVDIRYLLRTPARPGYVRPDSVRKRPARRASLARETA